MTDAAIAPTPETAIKPPRYLKRAVIVALFVALTGPLIGALTLLVFVFGRIIAGMSYDALAMPNIADLSQVVLVVSMFAYLLAGWSAVLSGAVLGVRTYTHGTFGYLFALGVAVVATIFGTASLDLILGRTDQSFVGMAIFFTPFSLVAAATGRWLLGRFGVLPARAAASAEAAR